MNLLSLNTRLFVRNNLVFIQKCKVHIGEANVIKSQIDINSPEYLVT